jgi:hypothetical protein
MTGDSSIVDIYSDKEQIQLAKKILYAQKDSSRNFSRTIITGIAICPFLLPSIPFLIFRHYKLKKLGETASQITKTCEFLNNQIEKAMKKYQKNDKQGFINDLQKENEFGKSILNPKFSEITADGFISYLLSNEVRPDGIACLMNFIGEALMSNQVVIPGKSIEDLETKAIELFEGICGNLLDNEAKKLDDKLKNLEGKRNNFLTNLPL